MAKVAVASAQKRGGGIFLSHKLHVSPINAFCLSCVYVYYLYTQYNWSSDHQTEVWSSKEPKWSAAVSERVVYLCYV